MKFKWSLKFFLFAALTSTVLIAESSVEEAGADVSLTKVSKSLLENAGNGNVQAQLELAALYYNQNEFSKTIVWLKQAAQLGSVQAYYKLGVMYDEGVGLSEDDLEAVKWYRLGAELGDPIAQSELGAMYGGRGNGVERDDVEAVKWYKLAALKGEVAAQGNLGSAYYFGHGVDIDYIAASEWFRLAAEQGLSEAQFILGTMYKEGTGVSIDYAESVKWYLLASAAGNIDAQINLAMAYADGQGVPKNEAKAFDLFRLVADKRHERQAVIQTNLGIYSYNGMGVEQDTVEAHKWFNLSALNGSEVGASYMEAIEEEMSISELERAEKRAAECLSSNYKVC